MAHNVTATAASPKITFNTRLARSVEKYPNIYNYHLGTYSNRQKKQKAWKKVAAELGSTVARCKGKWRNMRICYTDYIRKYMDETPEFLNSRSYLTEIMKFVRPFIRTRDDYMSVVPDTSAKPPKSPALLINLIRTKVENQNDIEIISDDDATNESLKMAVYGTPPLTIQKEEVIISAAGEIQNSFISTELPDLVPLEQMCVEIPNTDRKEFLYSNPRHQFLLSILPDLERMNDRQMRKFRSRVSTAIEEILEDEC